MALVKPGLSQYNEVADCFFSIVLIGVGAVLTPLIRAQSFRNPSLPQPVADPMFPP